jgi:regulator of protease activity HflC (stomatin/prohibitin superfamily)
MFGIRFIKVEPTIYVLQYRGGKIVREGAGVSFSYFAPITSLALIPIGSVDIPFIFQEVTADFQQVTVQGQITYRVADPKKLSQLMNFTLTSNRKNYVSEDPAKLPQRLINHTQVLTRASLQSLGLRDVLGKSDSLVSSLREGLRNAEVITALGIEVLDLSILAIKPTPETSRALEADARENILRQADEAIYARRNAAVEQERAIKENELNTEIAVENKKRQIKETQMEAEKSIQQKQREISEAEIATRIALEKKNKDFIILSTANAREEADAKAYEIAAMMKALSQTDPRTLQALASVGMDSGQLIALAFKALAEGTDKIGQLNVSPDLLRELLARDKPE